MATKMGQKRTTPQLPLKAKKGLNRMSDKAKEEMRFWLKIKAKRVKRLMARYGYIPCEHCGKPISNASELYEAQAHHLDKDRRHNDFENCRVLHASCHLHLHDHNIAEIPSLL